jgi:ATP-dependent RNA helicase RhlE
VSIHGNKSQGQRDRALAEFKSARARVLVATDVAARGIDIPAVRHVYNYDLPNVAENYVHRIGRTARAGKSGQAIAFCAPEEAGEFRAIQKIVKEPISVAGGAPHAGVTEAARPARGAPRRRRGGQNGQGRQRRAA